MKRPVALFRINRVEPDGTVAIRWASFSMIFVLMVALNLSARAGVHAVQGRTVLDGGDILSAMLLATGVVAYVVWVAWKEAKE